MSNTQKLTRENFIVRTSERSKWNKCRWAWKWSYHDLYSPTRRRIPLEFGDLIHRSLADYYVPETVKKRRRGDHPAQTFLRLYDLLTAQGHDFNIKSDADTDDEKWVAARELGEEMMVNYIDLYGKDMQWVVLAPEMPFSLPIIDDGRFVGTYAGVADAFIYDLNRGKYGLFEHKTAASISTRHLVLDEQAGAYWALVPLWLAENKILPKDGEMDFMLYNFMRKGTKDQRPTNALGQALNKDGSVSKKQPAALFKREIVRRGVHDRQETFDRIVQQMDEIFEAHHGRFQIYKQMPGGPFGCISCEFQDACELHEIGADWEE